MNYELAKKLKDAGFPPPELHSDGDYDSWVLRHTHGIAYSPLNKYEIRLFPGYTYQRDFVYAPTLSELIEACGNRFDELLKIRHTGEIYWTAAAYSCDECGWKDSHLVKGSTPEETVAYLWLKLNEK